MDIQTALNLARTEVTRWPQLVGWQVDVSRRSYRTLGLCRYRDRTILLSAGYVRLNDVAQVRGTVLHEIAHALVGPGHGHDAVWRAMAVQIGAKPVRCNRDAILPPGKWGAVCPACGRRFHLYRRPRSLVRWCRACRPERGRLAFLPNPAAGPTHENELFPHPDGHSRMLEENHGDLTVEQQRPPARNQPVE